MALTMKYVRCLFLLTLCLTLVVPAASASEEKTAPVVSKEPAPQNGTQAATLSSEEVAELAARAEEPGPTVAGGALSNEHLTYIVIALAAAVIVLIAK
jgi:hypothetical protein